MAIFVGIKYTVQPALSLPHTWARADTQKSWEIPEIYQYVPHHFLRSGWCADALEAAACSKWDEGVGRLVV